MNQEMEYLFYMCSDVTSLIFQASINQGILPSDWKEANVVPIHKKGQRSIAVNYRPVSLTSICCKILEHIIYSSLFAHLDEHKVLMDCQRGFRKGHSCKSQLLIIVNNILSNLDANKQTDVLLLDFAKAFDKVPHERLCKKLFHYGVRGSLLGWIKNFLKNRSQTVLLEGHKSLPKPVLSGVPQGTVLGPLLFLCYINDLPDLLISKIQLYADDVLLYSTVTSLEDCKQLQLDLHSLESWANIWQMQFNPDKCQHLRITNKHDFINFTYNTCNCNIQTVDHAKYLGVIIDNHLSWSKHISQITKKALSVKAFLQQNFNSCPIPVKAKLYTTLVRPILEFCCTVWSPYIASDIQRLEKVQRSTARYVFGDYSWHNSVTAMLDKLRWPTLSDQRYYLTAAMMYKIVHNLVAIEASSYLTPITSATRGHLKRYLHIQTRTNATYHSFFPSAVRIWNNLLACSVTASSLEQFKSH